MPDEVPLFPDSLIGAATRMIEEYGFHWWAIYTSYTTTNEPGLVISLVYATKSVRTIRATVALMPGEGIGMLTLRIESAKKDMLEIAESDGLEIPDSPRSEVRKPWRISCQNQPH